MYFPVLNVSIPPEALACFPKNLFLFGYFTAFMGTSEFEALRAQLGNLVPAPELVAFGASGPDPKQRLVMDFRNGRGLTGMEIAEIMAKHGQWFLFVEAALLFSKPLRPSSRRRP